MGLCARGGNAKRKRPHERRIGLSFRLSFHLTEQARAAALCSVLYPPGSRAIATATLLVAAATLGSSPDQDLQVPVSNSISLPLLPLPDHSAEWLLAQCRRFVADHAAEVRASGGVEQLRDLGVAKGLLGDALDQVAELKGAMRALRVAKD